MKLVFDGISWNKPGRPAIGSVPGLIPSHFNANGFRKPLPEEEVDPVARKWWVPNAIDPDRVRQYYSPSDSLMKSVGAGPILIDFEFHDDERRFDAATVEASIDAAAGCCDLLREMNPGRRIIPYNYPFAVWPSKLDDADSLVDWRRANGRLKYGREGGRADGRKGMSDRYDATAPSLYWRWPGWEAEAAATIEEAYRLEPDKPCYPWLWWRRHDSTGPVETRGEMIGHNEWSDMLRLVLERADGVILFDAMDPWTRVHHARLLAAVEMAEAM